MSEAQLGELSAYDTRKAVPGRGLLTTQWEQGADQVVLTLQAAYKNLADQKTDNVVLWLKTRKFILEAFNSRIAVTGLWAPRMDLRDLADRLAPEHWRPEQSEHVELVRAFFTDYTEDFWAHITDRLDETEANVHFEFVGPTGSGKSSCAVSVADWMSAIEPERLLEHLNFDLGELQDKLKTKKRRQTVIQDELLQLTGEGARTVAALFANCEDTLRKSGVSLFTCSPRLHEDETMQARLEAVLYNRHDKWTLFMVWKAGKPKGVVAIPWMRDELYQVYSEFKDANVERSLSGAFQDKAWVTRNACRFFDDPTIVDYLRTMVRGRQFTKADFERAIRVHRSDVMAATQRDGVASFMVEMVAAYKAAAPKFRGWFGVDPPDGLRALATKAQKARQEAAEDVES